MSKYLIALTILVSSNFCYGFSKDTIGHLKFIARLINEYDKPGRWLFIEVDSCDQSQGYEVVPLSILYDFYMSTNTSFNKKVFYQVSFDRFKKIGDILGFCPRLDSLYQMDKFIIHGKKINMQLYNQLKKQSISNILTKYFDKGHRLKRQYRDSLYELIAVCYKNNVSVITSLKEIAEYQVFSGALKKGH